MTSTGSNYMVNPLEHLAAKEPDISPIGVGGE